MRPKLRPSAMDQVKGMVATVRKAGMPICGSSQLISPRPVSIRPPTRMRAGAVAKVGMAPTKGAMKRERKKRIPVTMAVTPVRPPAATPAEDST